MSGFSDRVIRVDIENAILKFVFFKIIFLKLQRYLIKYIKNYFFFIKYLLKKIIIII